jgi:hypothetical protein
MTETIDNDLASRLKQHADDATHNHAKPHIEKLVAVRRTLLDLCSKGSSARQITEWLAKEGVHINDGTVRNYIARIRAAEQHAKDEGIQNPDDADILRICRDLERAKSARLMADKAAKSGRSTSKPTIQYYQTTSPRAQLYAPTPMNPRPDDLL